MNDFKDGYRVGDVVTARVNGLIGNGVIIAIGKNEYAIHNHIGKVFVIEGKDILGLNKGYVATVEQSEDALSIDTEKKSGELKFPIAIHFDKHVIEVVLKLKEDYDNLRYEVQRCFENVVELAKCKKEPLLLQLENDYLSSILNEVRVMMNRILEQQNRVQ